jgi:hypothetical protein
MSQRNAEVVVDVGERRAQTGSIPIRCDGGTGVAQVDADMAEHLVRLGTGAIQADRSSAGVRGLWQMTHSVQRNGAIHMVEGDTRTRRDGGVEPLKRKRRQAILERKYSQHVKTIRVLRRDGQDLLVDARGLLALPAEVQPDGLLVVGRDRVLGSAHRQGGYASRGARVRLDRERICPGIRPTRRKSDPRHARQATRPSGSPLVS